MKTLEDFERLKLGNRQLVIHIEEDANFQKTLVELSRFGRVMHLDWPIEVSLNPSVQEVKDYFINSKELVKINKWYPDGTVDSEYFPDKKTWKNDEDER